MDTEKRLLKRIQELHKKLAEIEEMHPGTLSQRYNVCGTSGCKCKDKKKPVKHGPYMNLSYTHGQRNRTKFIRKNQEEDYERYTRNYKVFRDQVEELIECNVELIGLRSETK